MRILLTFESDLTLTTFDGFGTFESAESAESRPGRKPDVSVGDNASLELSAGR